MKKVSPILFVVVFLLSSFMGHAQSFEGWISYKVEMQNPNPEMLPADEFEKQMKEVFGEKGYMPQKSYYKGNAYMSEITVGSEVGYQAYNPEDGLIYSWQAGSKSAVTLDSKKNMDSFVEFIDSEDTETIMGILCKSITIKSKIGEMKLWYNSDHLKIDPELYKGHLYGHFEEMLAKTGCLPIKIEQKGFTGHVIITALEYKEETVEDSKFTIPTFDSLSANPMN